MAKRLHDRRTSAIQTIEEAKALFNAIAISEIAIAKAKAQAEDRIATIKDQTAAKVAMIDPDLDAKREALSDFVETHPELFAKPRHVSTDFGRFGLQTASKVELFDKTACVEFVVDQGMSNCFETTYKPVAAGILAAIEAGTRVPGARILSGDIAHYTVRKALLDEAKEAE